MAQSELRSDVRSGTSLVARSAASGTKQGQRLGMTVATGPPGSSHVELLAEATGADELVDARREGDLSIPPKWVTVTLAPVSSKSMLLNPQASPAMQPLALRFVASGFPHSLRSQWKRLLTFSR